MTARGRTTSSGDQQGYWRRFGSTSGGGIVTRKYDSCSDITGPGDCDLFSVYSWQSSGGLINQQYDGGYFAAYFSNYIADGCGEANFPDCSLVGAVPTANESAMRAVNMTSPSRPYVDVVTNALQLGEIFTLLRDAGWSLIRRIGSTNLKYQFGIAPLVGDVVKLWRFNDQVDRRCRELERLKSDRGLRKTVNIGDYEGKASDSLTFQSQGALIVAPRSGHTQLNIRGHCRWSPTSVPELSTPKLIRAIARRAVTGGTIDFSTLWEIMPWSWLIDWGYDVGSYLRTYRNIVPATLSRVVVMEHTKTNWFAASTPPGDYGRTMSAFHFRRERKMRFVPIVAPSAHFPFLTGNQMGIIASLAIAGAKI